MEKIKFVVSETEEEVEFYVIEQTKINGLNYLLVTESDDDNEDADAYILKDLSEEDDAEAIYEMLEEDDEIEYVSKIFAELLEDIDLER